MIIASRSWKRGFTRKEHQGQRKYPTCSVIKGWSTGDNVLRKWTREEGSSPIGKNHEQECKGLGGRKLTSDSGGSNATVLDLW